MVDECIHGFDNGACATCFPPKLPESKPAAARTTRAPGSSTPRSASRPVQRTRAGASASRSSLHTPQIDVRGVRMYHVTHVDNLARILGSDAVLPDQGEPAAEPATDLSASEAREFRRQAPLTDDAVIAEYVPFTLTTDAHFWNSVRSGEPDPRLNPEVAAHAAADFVILVTSIGAAAGALIETPGQIVVTDHDAAAADTTAAREWPAAERLLRSLARDDDPRRDSAEVLIKGAVPLERLALIAVANDKVRDRVRTALSAVGARTRVAVYPPWYRPADIAHDIG